MLIGDIEFVTFTGTSDAFDSWYVLLCNTYNYDGKEHSTTSIQYADGCDLYEEDILTAAKEMNADNYDKVAELLYEDFCKKNNLVLLSYEKMEELEQCAAKLKA